MGLGGEAILLETGEKDWDEKLSEGSTRYNKNVLEHDIQPYKPFQIRTMKSLLSKVGFLSSLIFITSASFGT